MTLRQLRAMADGRNRRQWDHTSTLLAMLANVNRASKESPVYYPQQFHPYERLKGDTGQVLKLDAKRSMAFLKQIHGGRNG